MTKRLEKADVILAIIQSGNDNIIPTVRQDCLEEYMAAIMGEPDFKDDILAEVKFMDRYTAIRLSMLADAIVEACNGPENGVSKFLEAVEKRRQQG